MQTSYAHPMRRALAPSWPRPGWKSAGVLALLCSGVAWASIPRVIDLPRDEQRQWRALGIAPLSSGGVTGMPMAATDTAEPIEFAPRRAIAAAAPEIRVTQPPVETGPRRIHGQAGEGLYWSLRAAGATAQVAAQYLAALATEIDVGEVGSGDSFDLVLGGGGDDRPLLYAGLSRVGASPLQLVRWTANGRSEWVDADNADRPVPVESGMTMPANGPITSYFGYRYHPATIGEIASAMYDKSREWRLSAWIAPVG